MRRAHASLAFTAVLLLAASAGAQPTLDRLQSGREIRVVTAQRTMHGTFVSANGDSLLVQTGDATADAPLVQRWVPLECMRALQVPAGPSSARHASVVGGAIGTVFGAAIGAAVARSRNPRLEPLIPNAPVVGVRELPRSYTGPVVLGATAGALAGAAIAVLRRPRRWADVTLPPDAGRVAESRFRCAEFNY